MTSKKNIEISYIDKKVQQSPLITIEKDTSWKDLSIVDSQIELIDIKNSIIGILECTDIKEKIDSNNEWRHIYKIKEDISKHIYSIISKKYSEEEKKEIIKETLKSLTKNVSFVLTRWKNIYINDTWIKEKKVKI